MSAPSRDSDALDVGPGIAAWWVRAVSGLAAAGILADLVLHDAAGFVVGLVAVLGVLCVVLPASPVPLLVIVVSAVSLALVDPVAFAPGVLVLVPLGHLLHLSCAVTAVLPRGARIAPAALWPTLRRAVAVQFAVILFAVFALLIPAGRTAPAVELVALLSSAALALLVIFLDRSRG